MGFDFEFYLDLLEPFRVSAPLLPGPDVRLAQWVWPPLGSYNGFSGELRIRVWQLQRWGFDRGTLMRPKSCSVCGSSARVVLHSENYADPWVSIPLCQGCHSTVHGRFRLPQAWRRFQARHRREEVTQWFDVLPATLIDLAGWLICTGNDGGC